MPRLKIIAIILLLFFLPAGAAAQQGRVKFGPVVSAYLTGLAEELNELEFQIRHNEIARPDYERAKQRLTLLRRFVERRAAKNREDAVPEFQILATDEFNALGLGRELNLEELAIGVEFDGQWKLAEVDARGASPASRLFVFERIPLKQTDARGEGMAERKRARAIDLAAIETVVVNERPPDLDTPRTQPISQPAISPSDAVASPANSQTATARAQLPRILHIYLPEYTPKAREKMIEGELIVRAQFQRDGKIKEVKVEKGLGFGLDQRAADAVKRIGFFPAQVDGQEVDARVEIIFHFSLAKVSVYVRASQEGVMAKGAKP